MSYVSVCLHTASYPGPSHEKGEGLVYTVCTCVGLFLIVMGYPDLDLWPYLLTDKFITYTNLLPELDFCSCVSLSAQHLKGFGSYIHAKPFCILLCLSTANHMTHIMISACIYMGKMSSISIYMYICTCTYMEFIHVRTCI